MVGPGLEWRFEDGIHWPNADEPEKITFEGLKLKKCGHIFVVLVSDDHVRRHQANTEQLYTQVATFMAAGNSSDAIRAERQREESQKKFKSAARRAWREYNDLAPEGVTPSPALVSA